MKIPEENVKDTNEADVKQWAYWGALIAFLGILVSVHGRSGMQAI